MDLTGKSGPRLEVGGEGHQHLVSRQDDLRATIRPSAGSPLLQFTWVTSASKT